MDGMEHLTGKHDEVISFISAVRDLSPSLEKACLMGSCYRFHLVLKQRFPEAIPYMNSERNHVASLIGDTLYDITGALPGRETDGFHKMEPSEIRAASKWRARF